MEGAENYHAEQSRTVSWNMYQDYRAQSFKDPPLVNDNLGRKTRQRMRKTRQRMRKHKDMSPRAAA
jgi:hypothetical protein